MTNGNGNGNGAGTAEAESTWTMQQVYIKDLSFESPNSPAVFAEAISTNVTMNMQTRSEKLGDDVWEVALKINVHATAGEKSIFMVELDQAALFRISGFDEEEQTRILGLRCPEVLYPYAREVVSSVVSKGGFPPLVLQPISFGALFAHSQSNQKAAS